MLCLSGSDARLLSAGIRRFISSLVYLRSEAGTTKLRHSVEDNVPIYLFALTFNILNVSLYISIHYNYTLVS